MTTTLTTRVCVETVTELVAQLASASDNATFVYLGSNPGWLNLYPSVPVGAMRGNGALGLGVTGSVFVFSGQSVTTSGLDNKLTQCG